MIGNLEPVHVYAGNVVCAVCKQRLAPTLEYATPVGPRRSWVVAVAIMLGVAAIVSIAMLALKTAPRAATPAPIPMKSRPPAATTTIAIPAAAPK
jgi:hypothetical protein